MGTVQKDIQNLDDIKLLVDAFYRNVEQDPLIGPIFESRIKGNWQPHLEKMYRFWQTVLLEEHTYQGSPFYPHMQLPIEGQHFDRWLALFETTIDENFAGKKSEEAKWRAGKMALMFRAKLEYYRNSNTSSLL